MHTTNKYSPYQVLMTNLLSDQYHMVDYVLTCEKRGGVYILHRTRDNRYFIVPEKHSMGDRFYININNHKIQRIRLRDGKKIMAYNMCRCGNDLDGCDDYLQTTRL